MPLAASERANALEPAFLFAYPDTFSVYPGDAFSLHVSSNVPASEPLFVVLTSISSRDTAPRRPALTSHHPVAARFQPVSTAQASVDYQWPLTHSFTVGPDWISGIYQLDIYKGAALATLYFVVRSAAPSPGRILYKLNLSSFYAYDGTADAGQNAIGAPSLYLWRAASPTGQGYQTTMRRPMGGFTNSQRTLGEWGRSGNTTLRCFVSLQSVR